MSNATEILDYGDAVAEWLLDVADDCLRRQDGEGTLEFAARAASILAQQNRTLSSSRIEEQMVQVAANLLVAPGITPRQPAQETCLHVLTEALPAGGHTAMALRWMLNDCSGRRHSVALLRQGVPMPPALAQAVVDRGGQVYTADVASSLIGRAVWLRQLAYENASHVVLHVDVSEVICGAAFGIPGGPPLLLVNHAAHVFWIGGAVIDRLLNCRGSELEGEWAVRYRGIPRHAILPIPLLEPQGRETKGISLAERRQAARASLKLPPDAVVLLTVGASFKYTPAGGLDFVQTCERILADVPNAVMIAAGFTGDDHWQNAAQRTGNRIRTVGRLSQAELATWREAADIYLEGFPFGTTTSLLEAAQHGLPVVLAPIECPPPYGTDGVALDHVVKRPASVDEYARTVIRLALHPDERQREGDLVCCSVREHHTGDGWRRHLEAVIQALPTEHAIYSLSPHEPTPPVIYEHWSRFHRQWSPDAEQVLENALLQSYRLGRKPRLTPGMIAGCRRAERLRAGHTIPLPLLNLLCNRILIWLPAAGAERLFRLVAFLFRGALVARIGRRLRRWLGRAEAPQGAYGEYRQTPAPRN